jgi:hypothetical protein
LIIPSRRMPHLLRNNLKWLIPTTTNSLANP